MTRQENQSGWSHWQPLAGWSPSSGTLAELLDGGQSFRWHDADGIWTGLWSDNLAQLRLSNGILEWRAPAALQANIAAALPRYLAHDTDWPALTDSLPWRCDAHLAR